MSIEVLLIPLGMAAYAAWKESRRTDLCKKCRATRLTDRALLVEALEGLGATELAYDDDHVIGRTSYGSVTFRRVEDVFLGRVDDADDATTIAMLDALGSAAGRIVQNRSVEHIRERAAQLGMTLVVQRNEDDGSVELLFEAAS